MLFYFLLVGDERRPLGSFGFHQFTTTIIENKGHRTLGGLSATIIYSATSSTWSCSSSPPPSCGLLLLHSRRPSLLVIIGWHGGTHSKGRSDATTMQWQWPGGGDKGQRQSRRERRRTMLLFTQNEGEKCTRESEWVSRDWLRLTGAWTRTKRASPWASNNAMCAKLDGGYSIQACLRIVNVGSLGKFLNRGVEN